MLEPKHIVRLKLDRAAMDAHSELPLPRYVNKPLIGQFATISDAVLTKLLGIDILSFGQQLAQARKRGVELVTADKHGYEVGISAATSLVKGGDIMHKNLIVPQDFLRYDPKLNDHFVVGAFVRGQVIDGTLDPMDEEIQVVGWATSDDIKHAQITSAPPTFQSKLKVIMVPCASLRPIHTLLEAVAHVDTISA